MLDIPPMLVLISALIITAISGALYVVAKYRQSRWMMITFKPLTMLPIIGMAGWAFYWHPVWPLLCILVGLIFGLLGDVLLLKSSGFKAGLVAFLVGHCFHIPAFLLFSESVQWLWVLAYATIMLLCSCWLLRKIWPVAGRLRWPVLAYFIVIGAMGLSAMLLFSGQPLRLEAQLIIAGATLFLISDSVLGYDRLVRQQWFAPALISLTYYAAQALFALSAVGYAGLLS